MNLTCLYYADIPSEGLLPVVAVNPLTGARLPVAWVQTPSGYLLETESRAGRELEVSESESAEGQWGRGRSGRARTAWWPRCRSESASAPTGSSTVGSAFPRCPPRTRVSPDRKASSGSTCSSRPPLRSRHRVQQASSSSLQKRKQRQSPSSWTRLATPSRSTSSSTLAQ